MSKLTYEEHMKYESILMDIEHAEDMIKDSDTEKRAFYVETLELGDIGNTVADTEVEYWKKMKDELTEEKGQLEQLERDRENKELKEPEEQEEKEEIEEEDIEEEEE